VNDIFEENAELIQQGKSKERKPMITRIDFLFLFQKRQDGQQPVLLTASENIGEKIDHLSRIIKENILIWIVFFN
jgi:hypothetical protein